MRIKAIDLTKGIGIILVVVIHCIDRHTFVAECACAFHMPLFFFLSGLCYNAEKYNQVKSFTIKRCKQLLLPALYFTIFNILALVTSVGSNLQQEILHLRYGLPGALWFLVVLFVVEVVWCLLCNTGYLLSQYIRKFSWLFAILCFGIACILSAKDVRLPYSLSTTFGALSFYIIGHRMRQYCLQQNSIAIKYKLGIAALCACGLLVLVYATGHSCNMVTSEYQPIDFLSAILGISAVFLFCDCLPEKGTNVLAWLGKNSLCIMAVHITYIFLCAHIFSDLAATNKIEYKVVEQVFIWSLCVLTTLVINRYAKWMVGKADTNIR